MLWHIHAPAVVLGIKTLLFILGVFPTTQFYFSKANVTIEWISQILWMKEGAICNFTRTRGRKQTGGSHFQPAGKSYVFYWCSSPGSAVTSAALSVNDKHKFTYFRERTFIIEWRVILTTEKCLSWGNFDLGN